VLDVPGELGAKASIQDIRVRTALVDAGFVEVTWRPVNIAHGWLVTQPVKVGKIVGYSSWSS
jgi:hypothetical protein